MSCIHKANIRKYSTAISVYMNTVRTSEGSHVLVEGAGLPEGDQGLVSALLREQQLAPQPVRLPTSGLQPHCLRIVPNEIHTECTCNTHEIDNRG